MAEVREWVGNEISEPNVVTVHSYPKPRDKTITLATIEHTYESGSRSATFKVLKLVEAERTCRTFCV